MAAALLRFSALGSPSSHLPPCNPNSNPNLLLPTAIPFPSSSSSAAAASLPFHVLKSPSASPRFRPRKSPNPDLRCPIPSLGGGGGDGLKPPGGGSGGGGGAGWSSDGSPHEDPSVGVSACVLGDMASRPNFGLNELDFVFSTLVVGSILNFVLMYLLAPTSAASASAAALFAAVGFAAGLAGTAISNDLIAFRKRMDPNFESSNKPPPAILNAKLALHPNHMFEPGPYSESPNHMFEPGPYSLFKGGLFAAVGFAAVLGGTAISNGLIAADCF